MVATRLGQNGQNAAQLVELVAGRVPGTVLIQSQWEEEKTATALDHLTKTRHVFYQTAKNVSSSSSSSSNDG